SLHSSGVVEAGEGTAASGEVAQRADRLGGLPGEITHRHRAARLAYVLTSGSWPGAAKSGELGVGRRAVGTNPFGHLSPGLVGNGSLRRMDHARSGASGTATASNLCLAPF